MILVIITLEDNGIVLISFHLLFFYQVFLLFLNPFKELTRWFFIRILGNKFSLYSILKDWLLKESWPVIIQPLFIFLIFAVIPSISVSTFSNLSIIRDCSGKGGNGISIFLNSSNFKLSTLLLSLHIPVKFLFQKISKHNIQIWTCLCCIVREVSYLDWLYFLLLKWQQETVALEFRSLQQIKSSLLGKKLHLTQRVFSDF